MQIQTIDNYLPSNLFNNIRDILFDPKHNFPWFFADFVGSKKDKSDFYFYHLLYEHERKCSAFFEKLVHPLIRRQNFTYLYRAKCNLYTQKSSKIHTAFHVDMKKKHKVLLYNINTNNGFTMFENGAKVSSKENQAILFDGKLKHRSVAQTDKIVRINININYDF